MRKSSIYLPESLKQSLADLAGRSGRSEADLIRQAIESLIAIAERGEGTAVDDPAAPVHRQGPLLVGVGVGPGDPRYVTRLARDTLLGCDRVFSLSWSPRSVGRAEAVARSVAPTVPIERLELDITSHDGGRLASLRAAAHAAIAPLDAGESVAVVTLGDPAMWSVFPDLVDQVRANRPAVPIEMVPGIMSFQALSGATSTVLARPGQAVLAVEGGIPLLALDDPDTAVVICKGAPDLDVLIDAAKSSGRADVVRVGELLGQPGEHVGDLSGFQDGPLSYLATVILPAARGPLSDSGGSSQSAEDGVR